MVGYPLSLYRNDMINTIKFGNIKTKGIQVIKYGHLRVFGYPCPDNYITQHTVHNNNKHLFDLFFTQKNHLKKHFLI